MDYLSSMVWGLTQKDSNDKHISIDFGKNISGFDTIIRVERFQMWKQLFDENGSIKYVGVTVEGETVGSGPLYYLNGTIIMKGVLGNKGLICETEYYPNGEKGFQGLYKHNGGYGPNYPVYIA